MTTPIETNQHCAVCKEKCKQPPGVILQSCKHFARKEPKKSKAS